MLNPLRRPHKDWLDQHHQLAISYSSCVFVDTHWNTCTTNNPVHRTMKRNTRVFRLGVTAAIFTCLTACFPSTIAEKASSIHHRHHQAFAARPRHHALLSLQRGGHLEADNLPGDLPLLLSPDDASVATTEAARGGSNAVAPDDPKEAKKWRRNNDVVNSDTAKKESSIATKVRQRLEKLPREKVIAGSSALVVLSALLYRYREVLRPFLDKHYIQEHAFTFLKKLESQPGSLLIYILAMAIWEILGLTTIPVETAAGMVFGFSRGFVASGTGKMLGAGIAFKLGRSLMAEWVRVKLSQNPVWSVVDKSTGVHSPLTVAMLMKFSCFPEFIKNFGSACLDMPVAAFLLATCVHGLSYTALWTFLGVDAARRMGDPELPANMSLQFCLVLAALVGLVGSPLLMGWWIRDMTKRNSESDKQKKVPAKPKQMM